MQPGIIWWVAKVAWSILYQKVLMWLWWISRINHSKALNVSILSENRTKAALKLYKKGSNILIWPVFWKSLLAFSAHYHHQFLYRDSYIEASAEVQPLKRVTEFQVTVQNMLKSYQGSQFLLEHCLRFQFLYWTKKLRSMRKMLFFQSLSKLKVCRNN